MEDGEIKKSPAIDEVINISYKMFIFMPLRLTLFPSVATDSESEIRIEIFFECADSHPHFLECGKDRNNCLPEEIPYLKILDPPEKLLSWSKRNVHLPLSLIKTSSLKKISLIRKHFSQK